ncbi:EAL domain-containing protein [Falsirhodobacter algicola]|uniref:EAL domain-containing protein n=1 Tax=Falsirhodobacter algicola TaxID=2692330 RepID=A0A8J8SKB2_9RHOB|nr:EAL domain-containing protein [Falsirhodobacter algicola]QUS35680.1 EAL domain-containing protein [Falsirhodobacter algicola]
MSFASWYLVPQHDLRTVAIAVIVCVLSSLVGVSLIRRSARAGGRARRKWTLLAGISVGLGVWATHFIAMLSFMPGFAVRYDPGQTLLSLVIACAGTSIAVHYAKCRPLLSGAFLGCVTATMHYTGVTAMLHGGLIGWDEALVLASVLAGMALSALAFRIAASRDGSVALAGGGAVMALSIVALHFTGIRAMDMSACFSVGVAGTLSPAELGLAIGIAALIILLIPILVLFLDERDRRRAEVEERRLRELADVTQEGLLIVLEGRIINTNAAFRALTGMEAGMELTTAMTADDIQKLAGNLQDPQHVACRSRGGEMIPVEATMRLVALEVGVAQAIALRDLRSQVRIEKARRADAELIARIRRDLHLALENMSQGIVLFDADGTLVLHNARLCEMFGLSPAAQLDLPVLEGALMQSVASVDGEAPRHWRKRQNAELLAELHDGRSVQIVHRPVPAGGWVSTFEDVSERTRTARQIIHMARHDALTGLPNRTSFAEHIEWTLDALEEDTSARLAVVGIDLDRFKEINDHMGHAIGDEVLMTVANRMNALLGEGEFVARFGGDEFAAYKQFTDMADLTAFTDRLMEAICQSLTIEQHELSVGASIGIAVAPFDGMDFDKLINNADMAMYRAKASLSEKVCFYESQMDEASRDRRNMARDLWHAVERDEMYLHHQIQKSVSTGQTTGYEVLLRWTHPERGPISPADFIPVAEECGAIIGIGEWVLRRACAQAARWCNGHRIAVNLSPVQLVNSRFVAQLRDILEETGLDPSRLELEVTETTIISDKARALQMLTQIKALGVSIAIDDFGTGYSSLDTLRSFPFDKIKLDRSFVREVETDAQCKAIIRAILALGRSLEVPVLAEGVETLAQLDLLRAEGCDEAQGYLLGRPGILDASMAQVA